MLRLDLLKEFSKALPFSYAHLAALCRRKVLVQLFGEDPATAICPEYCCNVCEMPTVLQKDRKLKLCVLVQTINELPSLGEVKVTEWVRGGEIAWMRNVNRHDPTAYNSSPPGLSKEWWRIFIRQVSASGYILRTVKPAAFGISIQGAYAHLEVTEKGRNAISKDAPVLLPESTLFKDQLSLATATARRQNGSKQRTGKGKHLLPILKNLLTDEENWLRLMPDNKETYQFPGWHDTIVGNVLYYTDNVTDLPQHSGDHHLWHDIQFSKAGTTKNTMSVVINEKKENLSYWMSQCSGVKNVTIFCQMLV